MKHRRNNFSSANKDNQRFPEDKPSLTGFIGYLKVNLFIPYSHSLKERRRVMERIKQRARNNFNISVAEMPADKWQKGELFFVCTNYKKSYARDLMERIESFIRLEDSIHIMEAEKGVL